MEVVLMQVEFQKKVELNKRLRADGRLPRLEGVLIRFRSFAIRHRKRQRSDKITALPNTGFGGPATAYQLPVMRAQAKNVPVILLDEEVAHIRKIRGAINEMRDAFKSMRGLFSDQMQRYEIKESDFLKGTVLYREVLLALDGDFRAIGAWLSCIGTRISNSEHKLTKYDC